MRLISFISAVVFLIAALPPGSTAVRHTGAQEPTSIVVTNASDGVDDEETVCPDEALCTLRRAIELANGLGEEEIETAITFDPAVFPAGEETVIQLAAVLPALSHPGTIINAAGQRVTLDGSEVAGNPTPGLRLDGDGQVVRGLGLRGFFGPCIAITGTSVMLGGNSADGEGLRLGDCAVGIDVRGAEATISGCNIGYWYDDSAVPVTIGIRVLASRVTIGATEADTPFGNVIANAATGVLVGGGVEVVEETRISRNRFGQVDATVAPVIDGVVVKVPAERSEISENVFLAVTRNAIAIGPTENGTSATGHRISFNAMAINGVGGLGIDLGDDGQRNPNDPGDIDSGPNNRMNSPVIGKATVTRVSGSAGATCAGCTIELFRASHLPGGKRDYGAEPFAAVIAGAQGEFGFDAPPLHVGDWVVATATDTGGNTSEFSAGAVVGAGAVQCSGTVLGPGWTHAGYFGTNATPLGASFPATGPDAGKVTAIYHLLDGGESFEHWLAGDDSPDTLSALEPGEAYFFLATAPVTLPGGFTLTVPFPVALAAGWNDVVYIGQSYEVRDALGSLGTHLLSAHRFAGGWQTVIGTGLPQWAWEKDEVVACTSYMVLLDQAATLTPLQP